MNARYDTLVQQYRSVLHDCLSDGGEENLNRAYELGRSALVSGAGLLDVVAIHQAALGRSPAAGGASDGAFRCLSECLSPFEMSHRGSIEAAIGLKRLNETLENEAKRIAQALHDEAGQLLASVHIALDQFGRELGGDARARVAAIAQMLKETERALRDLSHELQPLVLEHLGLLAAIHFLAEGVGKRSGLVITVRGNSRRRLPAPIESALYRAVQEGLNNVVKHARARDVDIHLRWGTRSVACRLSDDGIGPCRPAQADHRIGLGLIGIRDRLSALGGSFRLHAAPGAGTVLVLRVPL